MSKITMFAIGRCKDKPIIELVERYRTRLGITVTIRELAASNKPAGQAATDDEAARLLEAASKHPCIIALDERGQDWTSEAWANYLQAQIEAANTPIAIMIGGADGLGDAIRKRADRTLCFGRLTWPHMLVRAMLMEQLYRAETIIRGHPYHRS